MSRMLQEKELELLRAIDGGELVNKVDSDVVHADGTSATDDLRKLARNKYTKVQFVDCGWINQMILGLTDKGKEALEEAHTAQ